MTGPSPDLPAYRTVKLLDYTEQTVAVASTTYLQTAIPELVIRENSVEMTLLEAAAIITGQEVYALNNLPQEVFDRLLVTFGVPRNPAVPGSALMRVTLSTTAAGTKLIPAGAGFRILLADGSAAEYRTTHAVTLNPADGLPQTFPVTAVTASANGNGTPIGTSASLVQTFSFIDAAQLGSAVSGGVDAETDDTFYPRAAARLRRQTSALVLAEQFKFAALDWPGVGRAQVFDKWNSTGTPGGTNLGHVTVAVADPAGIAISTDAATALTNSLTSQAIAGLNVHVVGPNSVSYALTIAVSPQTGTDPTALATAVRETVNSYLNPGQWPWGQRVYANDIIVLVGQVPGVARVTSVTGPGLSVVPGPLDLPATPGSVTVNIA